MSAVSSLPGPTRDHLDWPFFDERHREFVAEVDAFAKSPAMAAIDHKDVDSACRKLVKALGNAGLLAAATGTSDSDPLIDSRLVCLARETLAWHDGLADFAFAMQGLGTGAIGLSGSPELRAAVLPKVGAGDWLSAFALSERDAGSDVAAMSCAARTDGDHYVLDGEKTWISNGGIADVYTVFARTGEAPGTRGISAFVVFADDPGFSIVERIEVIAPHPLARLKYDNARIPADAIIGEPGEGFRIGMETLNLFRVTVGAAALGFARRALDEALAFSSNRRLGTATLADNSVTQAKLADMALAIDASALLIYRAAWQQDEGGVDNRRAAAMAKLQATESAQAVIDAAVQMHGGAGVTRGVKVEELYRDIRSLRIYEGASEVQRQIIARDLLKGG